MTRRWGTRGVICRAESSSLFVVGCSTTKDPGGSAAGQIPAWITDGVSQARGRLSRRPMSPVYLDHRGPAGVDGRRRFARLAGDRRRGARSAGHSGGAGRVRLRQDRHRPRSARRHQLAHRRRGQRRSRPPPLACVGRRSGGVGRLGDRLRRCGVVVEGARLHEHLGRRRVGARRAPLGIDLSKLSAAHIERIAVAVAGKLGPDEVALVGGCSPAQRRVRAMPWRRWPPWRGSSAHSTSQS